MNSNGSAPFLGELMRQGNELRRDLKEVAALLKWSGVDLMKMAVRLSEAGFEDDARELLTIISGFPDAEDKLMAYADEVKDQRITRAKANS
ncbi:Phage tail protein [Pseudomonas chlororaphis]